MRFMVMHKQTAEMEQGLPPSPEVIAGVNGLIGEAIGQGIFLGGEGLKPSGQRSHLAYRDGRRTITDGPFADQGQLPAGFAVLRVRSREQAVACCDWLAAAAGDLAIHLGPVHEPWDLGFGDRPADAPERYLALPEADAASERDEPAFASDRVAALLAAMREEGVVDASGALAGTRHGARIRMPGGKVTVLDGPFAESKELVAGYAIFELPSLAAAVEFSIRFGHVVQVDEIDVRVLA